MVSRSLIRVVVHALLLQVAIAATTNFCALPSTGQKGVCTSSSSCKSSKGTVYSGSQKLCGSTSSNVCCTYGHCTHPTTKQSGWCIPSGACTGTLSSNRCPGNSDIKCCTYGSCSGKDSISQVPFKGLCQPSATCGAGSKSLANQGCGGPKGIQCCVGKDCRQVYPEVNDKGKALIRGAEGFGLPGKDGLPYQDSGNHWTVGYGHLCDQSKQCKEILSKYGFKSFPLTKAQGEVIFKDDLYDRATQYLVRSTATCVKLNANQYAALASLFFQMGSGTVEGSTMFKRLNNCEDPTKVVTLATLTSTFGYASRREKEFNLFKDTNGAVHALPAGKVGKDCPKDGQTR